VFCCCNLRILKYTRYYSTLDRFLEESSSLFVSARDRYWATEPRAARGRYSSPYMGTSLTRNRPPPRTARRPCAYAYCRVEPRAAWGRYPKHCTPNHALCILQPAPCTPHPTPYTPHPSPHTLHPTPCTLQTTPPTLHPTPFTLHPKL